VPAISERDYPKAAELMRTENPFDPVNEVRVWALRGGLSDCVVLRYACPAAASVGDEAILAEVLAQADSRRFDPLGSVGIVSSGGLAGVCEPGCSASLLDLATTTGAVRSVDLILSHCNPKLPQVRDRLVDFLVRCCRAGFENDAYMFRFHAMIRVLAALPVGTEIPHDVVHANICLGTDLVLPLAFGLGTLRHPDQLSVQVMRVLIGAGLDPDSRRGGTQGQTLLHCCAISNHAAMVTLLLESGADPCLRDASGQTFDEMAERLSSHEALAALHSFSARRVVSGVLARVLES
jgi:hypothetical protein